MQSSILASNELFLPSSESMNIWRSPSWALSKTNTGQTSSLSALTSQHIPWRSMMFGWHRIKGFSSTNNSETNVLKLVSTSCGVYEVAAVGECERLNAKPVWMLISDWLISAVAPRPRGPRACSHVIGKKSTLYCWATDRTEIRSIWPFVDDTSGETALLKIDDIQWKDVGGVILSDTKQAR